MPVCVFQYPMPRLHTTEEVMENAKRICEIVKGVKIVSFALSTQIMSYERA